MPTPTVEKPRPLCPAGEHTFTLREVIERDFDSQYSKRADGKTTKWLWRFESNQTTEDDEPYEHTHFTNTVYGNPKASLTLLLDQLVPGMTVEQAETLDTDKLLHKRFKGMIRHERTDKGDIRAVLAFIAPIVKKTQQAVAPAPAPEQEEEEDTFADE